MTVLDYSVGNLHSIRKALMSAGAEVEQRDLTPDAVADAEALVLPGVGAFDAAANQLDPVRDILQDRLREGTPLLGICLGMQLLLDESEEGTGKGLGWVPGRVTRLPHRKLPQIGWNNMEPTGDHGLLQDLPPDPHVYYVNSYAPEPEDEAHVLATTPYGKDFAAIVRRGNAVGTQFHPEKSSVVGLTILRNWVREAREGLS